MKAVDALSIAMNEYVRENQLRTVGDNVYERIVSKFRDTDIDVNLWVPLCPIGRIIPHIIKESRPVSIISHLVHGESLDVHVDLEPLNINLFNDDRDERVEQYGTAWFMGTLKGGAPFYGERDCLDVHDRINGGDYD